MIARRVPKVFLSCRDHELLCRYDTYVLLEIINQCLPLIKMNASFTRLQYLRFHFLPYFEYTPILLQIFLVHYDTKLSVPYRKKK